jgi:8-oxo-dGTP pyrophosphatase MutT (NUDIX family)
MDQQVLLAAKGLIQTGDKYLVIKQNIGGQYFYDLPGGKLKYGESPVQALAREVKEELNIEVSSEKFLGFWWFFRKTDNAQVICATYLCKTNVEQQPDLSKNLSDTEQIVDVSYVSKQELMKLMDYPNFSNISL